MWVMSASHQCPEGQGDQEWWTSRQSQRKESELMPAPLLVYKCFWGKWLEAIVHPETNLWDLKPCHGTVLDIKYLSEQASFCKFIWITRKCKHTAKWVFHNLKYYSVRHACPNSTLYFDNFTTF